MSQSLPIAVVDEELRAAAGEVDLRVLRWAKGLSPLERLRHAASMNRTITRLRRAKTKDR